MEGFKIDLLVRDKDVAVDGVEGQDPSCEYIGLLEHGLF